MRYTKKLTVKERRRFDKIVERENGVYVTAQEILLKKYDVILTDHQTQGERVVSFLSKFNSENLDRSITLFKKNMNKVDKAFETWDKMKGQQKDKHDYSFLTGDKRN